MSYFFCSMMRLVDRFFFLFKFVLQLHGYFYWSVPPDFLLSTLCSDIFSEVVFRSLIRSVKWFKPRKSLDSNLSLAGSSKTAGKS
uniref:Uncharacterized protein n=1 Tax=Klebsiella pneumoniae TaxID=573 RepID=A0A8B0SRM2_KLEPN|nr:hypothetical protein [Klebsiella pneumoniae]